MCIHFINWSLPVGPYGFSPTVWVDRTNDNTDKLRNGSIIPAAVRSPPKRLATASAKLESTVTRKTNKCWTKLNQSVWGWFRLMLLKIYMVIQNNQECFENCCTKLTNSMLHDKPEHIRWSLSCAWSCWVDYWLDHSLILRPFDSRQWIETLDLWEK